MRVALTALALAAVPCSLRLPGSRDRRRRPRTATALRRPPSVPRIACARCARRLTRSPPSSAPCSPTSAGWSSSDRSAVEQLAKVERERVDVQRQLDAAEAKAAVLAETAAAQLPDIEARLVQLYKMGRAGYWRLLLSVDDLQAIGRAYRTVSTLNAIDRARVNEHYATLDALARERKTLQERADRARGAQGRGRHARAPPPTGPWRRGRRLSTRSTPAAISTPS